ncbi:hypothetical protein AB4Z54_52765, partial [Streptomyces sp. MCAF7]
MPCAQFPADPSLTCRPAAHAPRAIHVARVVPARHPAACVGVGLGFRRAVALQGGRARERARAPTPRAGSARPVAIRARHHRLPLAMVITVAHREVDRGRQPWYV